MQLNGEGEKKSKQDKRKKTKNKFSIKFNWTSKEKIRTFFFSFIYCVWICIHSAQEKKTNDNTVCSLFFICVIINNWCHIYFWHCYFAVAAFLCFSIFRLVFVALRIKLRCVHRVRFFLICQTEHKRKPYILEERISIYMLYNVRNIIYLQEDRYHSHNTVFFLLSIKLHTTEVDSI